MRRKKETVKGRRRQETKEKQQEPTIAPLKCFSLSTRHASTPFHPATPLQARTPHPWTATLIQARTPHPWTATLIQARTPHPWTVVQLPGVSPASTSVTSCPQSFCSTVAKDLVYKDPARPNIQKTCTFKELVYETVKVPGCAHHADSLYTYPVATACHCGKCNSDSTDCTVRGLGPSYCSFGDMKE
uniref:Follitropin subunit beta n=1 Tax=Equus asinus TaxID=9793 RepID=A0A9L0IEB5_EQUAS